MESDSLKQRRTMPRIPPTSVGTRTTRTELNKQKREECLQQEEYHHQKKDIEPINETFKTIHEELLHINVEEIYHRLKTNLTLGDQRLNVDAMVKSVDDTPKHYYDARMLLLNAIKMQRLFKMDKRKREAELFSSARNNISVVKPTKQDIEDYVYVHYFEEMKELEERDLDLDGIVKTLEVLEEVYKRKIFALDVQIKLKNDRSRVI